LPESFGNGGLCTDNIIQCTSQPIENQRPRGSRAALRAGPIVPRLRERPMSTIRDLFTKPVLIFGCGNSLIGDDGFGPAVVEHLLENFELPARAAAFDAGTGVRELLLDLVLMPEKPKLIYIVDSVFDSTHRPGEIFEMDISGIPSIKVNDYSLHQFPSVNLLRELREEAGVNVRVLAVQVGKIPDAIRPGLSEPVSAAVPEACQWLLAQIEEMP
jgi:coenzyme F420 hydrogenase subunit delta